MPAQVEGTRVRVSTVDAPGTGAVSSKAMDHALAVLDEIVAEYERGVMFDGQRLVATGGE